MSVELKSELIASLNEVAEATLFTYNETTGDVNGAVTDLDFRWEAEVSNHYNPEIQS